MAHSVSHEICLDEQVLLHEPDHRIVNGFASAISAVFLAARQTTNDEAKVDLRDVAGLLHHYANIHRALQMPIRDIHSLTQRHTFANSAFQSVGPNWNPERLGLCLRPKLCSSIQIRAGDWG
jgi:two-component sensor histidine kinase